MNKHFLLFTLAVTLTVMVNAQTNITDANDASTQGYLPVFTAPQTVTNSTLYQDANGNVGIGSVAPAALLHLNQNNFTTNFTPADYFAITETALTGYPAISTAFTKFIVKADGKVGIGTADPQAPLQVQTLMWNGGGGDLGEPIALFADPNDNVLGGFFNEGTDEDHTGGAFVVTCSNNASNPAFAVLNKDLQQLPFAVMGDGTIAMGVDISNNFNPQAQINIAKNNTFDYLIKLQSSDQSNDYLTVHNNGFVGIGTANAGNATFAVVSHDDNIGSVAAVSIVGTSSTPRFLYAGNSSTLGSNTSTYLSVKSTGVGVGTDDLSLGSTLAVKGSSSGTNLDLYETSSSVEYNAQLRFIGSNGTTIRHLITENSDGELLVVPGFNNNAAQKLKVEGNVQITGVTGIGLAPSSSALSIKAASGGTLLDIYQNNGITGWNGQLRFVKDDATVRHIITDDYTTNNLVIHPGVGGSANGMVQIEGKVKIGDVTTPSSTNSDYMLYVQKGILSERFKCALKTDNTNWSDYVFDKDYKLMKLDDLEKYVNKNHHLPNIPSATEVYRDGIDLGDMDALLLEKIEELSLYVINLKKQINELKK